MKEDNPKKDYLLQQRDFCGIFGIDFEKVEKINSRLISLTEHGVSWTALKTLFNSFKEVNENLEYCMDIRKLSSGIKIRENPKEKSLMDLFLYLLLVEGVFSKVVGMVSILLIENDHDLYDPQEMKFLTKFQQIDQLSLFIKLQFLEKHGFELIVQAVDRELRNRIAHIDIEVNLDGKIINKRTGKIIDDLSVKINFIIGLSSVVILALEFALNKNNTIKFDQEMQRFKTKPNFRKPKKSNKPI